MRRPRAAGSDELAPDDCVHTLIEVITDEGLTGLGSVFTSAALVEASLQVLRPLYTGESAIEPERVSEKLHQHTFWQGRGGAITHTISGIDIALWDILGQVTGQPIGRLLGGRYKERIKPYASLLMDEPARAGRTSAGSQGTGISRLQDRLGTVWPVGRPRLTKRSCVLRVTPSARTAI